MRNLSSIMAKDVWGNNASVIIVRNNKATFATGIGHLTRSIKNNSVVVDNERFKLDKELIKNM
jgi:hypothetical protein